MVRALLGQRDVREQSPVSIRLTGLKLRCSASTVPNACDRDDLVSVVNPVNEAVRTDDGFASKGFLFLRNHSAALWEKPHDFCLLDEFFTKSLSGSGIVLRDEITNAA